MVSSAKPSRYRKGYLRATWASRPRHATEASHSCLHPSTLAAEARQVLVMYSYEQVSLEKGGRNLRVGDQGLQGVDDLVRRGVDGLVLVLAVHALVLVAKRS
jgi:hypothetical protein